MEGPLRGGAAGGPTQEADTMVVTIAQASISTILSKVRRGGGGHRVVTRCPSITRHLVTVLQSAVIYTRVPEGERYKVTVGPHRFL